MNWIEILYEIKNKDLYSQGGEGLILEYIFSHIKHNEMALDIGGGDGIYLSNTRHLKNIGWSVDVLDRENGQNVTVENIDIHCNPSLYSLISIDIDGNDYWILDRL